MGNREENISCIPKTSLTDIKDKSRTKLTSISFFSLINLLTFYLKKFKKFYIIILTFSDI